MEIKLLGESTAQIIIDGKLYSAEVIHKCFYWYGAKYSVDIKTEGDVFIIDITELSNEGTIGKIFPEIKNDLIDFKTREIVSTETKNIREMIIAKAFAFGDEFDEPPSGNVNDPIGFEPSKF
jgi:His-Xaa-Ser system protein HxsD